MRASYFEVDCTCGRRLQTESKPATCGACGRMIMLEWPARLSEVVLPERGRAEPEGGAVETLTVSALDRSPPFSQTGQGYQS